MTNKNNTPQTTISTTGVTTSASNYIFFPTLTSTYSSIGNYDTYFMTLPVNKSKMPYAVYLNGSRLTIGIPASDTQCSILGDRLYISSSIVTNPDRFQYIILEYKDRIYNYLVGDDYFIKLLDNSNEIDAKLLSTIIKK